MMRHAIVAAVLCMAVAAVAVDPDFISNLPGAPANLGYDQYAGYLTVNQTNGRQLFYWFVESQNSPSTDPVVLWLNGGPGCSSLLGAFGENGPLWINKDGATLRKNPSSWNRVANVIYLESPAGVGFSTSNVTSDYTVGDARTAMDAYIFLVKFFAKFPQFANLPFWVSGESYGGHYVPNLAKTILEQNAKGINPKVNLVGFQVGNAWTDATIDNEMSVHFWHSHALISDESAAGALANCDFSKIGPLKGEADDACDNYLDQATTAMAGINIYEIYSDICLEGGRAEAAQLVRALANSGARTAFTKQMAHALSANRVGAAAGEEVTLRDEHPDADPCIDNHLAAYMNRKEVQKAIHANINYPWTGCSSIINYSYADLLSSMLPVYKWLLTNPVKLQMLVYSGDIDAIVSVMGTRAWLQKLALPIKEQWRPYKVDQQVGGWTVKYDGLTFATVRDAGHMVPWVQPERSFYIFSKFLKQQPF